MPPVRSRIVGLVVRAQQVLLPASQADYIIYVSSEHESTEENMKIYIVLMMVYVNTPLCPHQVPSTPTNVPVGSGASYVYIKSVRNGTWPNTTVISPNNASWDFTVIEADICASNDFSITRQSVIHISNPLIWWTNNQCAAQGWAPCTPYSFYTYNNWVRH